MSIAYLNGQYLPLADAKVSVLDRGFLFADGVYEVIPAYNGKMFRFEAHIERLQQSLAAIHLALDMNLSDWQAIAEHLLEVNQLTNAGLYLQVTRGVSPIRSHEFPADAEPTILAMVSPLPDVDLSLAVENKGISAITAEDIRWQRCDIKSTGLLANCLLQQKALESGADDTILVRNGKAIEATASNLFMVSGEQVITPSLDQQILAGVTRDFVIQLVRKGGLELIERSISVDELAQADEIWLTSSNKEIRPLVRLNGAKIGNGRPGSIWQQVNQDYQHLKQRLYQGHHIDD